MLFNLQEKAINDIEFLTTVKPTYRIFGIKNIIKSYVINNFERFVRIGLYKCGTEYITDIDTGIVAAMKFHLTEFCTKFNIPITTEISVYATDQLYKKIKTKFYRIYTANIEFSDGRKICVPKNMHKFF